MIKINLKKDFTGKPFGRFYTDESEDSKCSGERFLNELLLPALIDTNEKIEIDLETDYGWGVSSGFYSSGFSNAVNHINPKTGKYFTGEELKSRITFVNDDDELYVTNGTFDTIKRIENARASKMLSVDGKGL